MCDEIKNPENYLRKAIVATVICSAPFGIVAVIFASKVDLLWSFDKKQEAITASRIAKKWSTISIIVGVSFYILYFIYFLAEALSQL